MNKSKVEEVVLGIFKKDTGRQDTNSAYYLFTDLDLDSLDVVEIVMEIEDTLDISIDGDMFDNCNTINDIIDIAFDLVKDK